MDRDVLGDDDGKFDPPRVRRLHDCVAGSACRDEDDACGRVVLAERLADRVIDRDAVNLPPGLPGCNPRDDAPSPTSRA